MTCQRNTGRIGGVPGVAPLDYVVSELQLAVRRYSDFLGNQATLLVQVGLLDPARLPVAGAEQARRLLDPTQPANEMISRLAKP